MQNQSNYTVASLNAAAVIQAKQKYMTSQKCQEWQQFP